MSTRRTKLSSRNFKSKHIHSKDGIRVKSEDVNSRYNVGYKRLTRRTLRKTFSKIITYKYLTLNGIELPYDWEYNDDEYATPLVPPPTPQPEDFGFEFRFQRLPNILQDLSTLEIPLVRKCGIKRCVEELGLYFGCHEYKYNYLQYWFLDILTDCIWRAQDRYEFSPEQQKIILSWILFVIDVIGDVNYSYTQKEFFGIFKESIIAAAEILEEGGNEIILPLKLIKIRTGHDSELGEENDTYVSSEKSCSLESTSTEVSACSDESKPKDIMDYDSVYEIHLGRDKLQVVLDHEVCQCSNYDESLSGHLKEEAEIYENSEMDWMEMEEEEIFEQCDMDINNWDYRDFYKPSSRTPSRFLLSSSEEITEVTETLQKETNLSLTDLGSLSKLTFLRLPNATRTTTSFIKTADKLNNYIIFRKLSFSTMDDTVEPEEPEIVKMATDIESKNYIVKEEVETQEQQIEKIMKGLQKLKLIEQRMRNLSDSQIGLSDWQIYSPIDEENKKEPSVKEDACIPDQILRDHVEPPQNLDEINDNELMNFAILWAIIDFVYDYFSDSFQYSMIKSALTVSPNVFTQVINKQYQIPKKISEDLTSKVPDLKDKNKKFVRKIDLRKSTVSEKKVKDKEEKETKTGKKGEKDKEKETKKKERRESKEIKLTKEELLLIQKLEQEEALRLKLEKEKAFLIPLSEAVNDRFFSRKFPNWSKFESITLKEKITEKKKK